ncbi:hypothetical protein QHH03_31120, partial [Aphanizomenon sp. 202]|nr:hypothetical protein [Aphanizomenon sp. 202]
EDFLPRNHLFPNHEGGRRSPGLRILEEFTEEDEQVAVPRAFSQLKLGSSSCYHTTKLPYQL